MRKRSAQEQGLTLEEYEAQRHERIQRTAPRCNVWFRECAECGQGFVARRSGSLVCSAACRQKRDTRQVSESIMRRYYRDGEFRELVMATAQKRRATKLGLGGQVITLGYLVQRDDGRCGICGKQVKPGEESLDHIVPLSHGGEHVLSNVQLAHRSCNYSKGNRGGGEQLLLVG